MEEVLPLKRPSTHAELLAFARELLAILSELYAADYLHCDLKPENLGRRANGSLVVLDWGCVLTVEMAAKEHISAGTKHYRAPEAAQGQLSILSEIRSVAKMLFYFASLASRHRLGPALLKATDDNPDERPSSYEEFLELLENCESSFRATIRLYLRLARTAIISAEVMIGTIAIVNA